MYIYDQKSCSLSLFVETNRGLILKNNPETIAGTLLYGEALHARGLKALFETITASNSIRFFIVS